MKSNPLAGDMDAAQFREHARHLADWIADYLEHAERYPVLARTKPGDVRRALPPEAPERGESFPAIFDDFERLLLPGITHWNHPGFFGYFAISGSAPGVLGEFLAAGLNVQAMLWRTSPAATELEEVSLAWLRQLLGMPDAFEGVIYDTAAVSTLHALAMARHATVPDVGTLGLAGRPDIGRLRARPRGAERAGDMDEDATNALNERLLDRVNASGGVFLSHTRLEGRYVLRLAVGHIRTTEVHVTRAWALLRQHLAELQAALSP